MRTALAIFCTLVLFWTQGAVAACASGNAEKAQCNSCACADTTCCFSDTTPASQPEPAAPARTLSESQLQLLVILTQHLVALPEPTALQGASPLSFPASAGPVPLYQRNCAWLI